MVRIGKATDSTLKVGGRLGITYPFGILGHRATGFSHPPTVYEIEGSYRSLVGRSGRVISGRPIASFKSGFWVVKRRDSPTP